MERAAQEMENQSAAQALAAGTRAQERMQNLREDLRRQTSSRFSEQMRDLRNQAREMSRQQEEIARGLDALNNGERQSLDNSAERREITRQMARQQSALTNLLGGMRNVTEQAETTEPLLSQKLYDTLRRADQMHTDNLLEMGTQLVDRGFLPQASQMERSARTNINELRQSVERAAESVLGSEAEALRFAQRELDDLTEQVQREISGGGTNGVGAGQMGGAESQSNRLARAAGRASEGNAPGTQGTNSTAGESGRPGEGELQLARNNSQRQQGSAQNSNPGEQASSGQRQGGTPNSDSAREQAANSRQSGQAQNAQGQAGQGREGQPREGDSAGGGRNQSQLASNNSSRQQNENQGRNGGQRQQGAQAGGAQGGEDRLRQFAEQLGGAEGRGGTGGPITGNNFVDWSDRLRDVERVLDPADLRNQLATVRERVGAFRGEYRERGRAPDEEVVRKQILAPLTQVRVWLQEELVRQQNSQSLVPLDRDPVPEHYSELVRKYYEKLGSAQ